MAGVTLRNSPVREVRKALIYTVFGAFYYKGTWNFEKSVVPSYDAQHISVSPTYSLQASIVESNKDKPHIRYYIFL